MSISRFSLEGRVAIVTGAKRGIGKAIAVAFAEAGANVVVATRVVRDATGDLEAVADEIRQLGRRSLAIQADVSQKADVDNMVRRTMEEFGFIDILVNNAGIGSGPPLIDTPEDTWDRVIDVDLKSCYLCSQAAGRTMIERRRGSIINISSAGGIRGFSGRNTYNIAKAGVIMLTKVLARDLGKHNIRANAIAPTIIKTPMTQGMTDNPQAAAAEAARIPLGRLGEVEDIVGPAIFLASDASSYISGDTIVVDGGQLS
jgi:NAD(P)-dependent dehydrogenase (short-subunit alcohol dehydrogenase family)